MPAFNEFASNSAIKFSFFYREKDWTQREAYLQLHRREKLGLPLVDKNYIDPAKIELPSDEELGDTDIVI